MGHERRGDDRIDFQGQAYLKAYLVVGDRCRRERVIDISRGGLLLRSHARLRPGTSVRIFLPLRGGEGAFRMCPLVARVVRRAGATLGLRVRDPSGLLGAWISSHAPAAFAEV